MKTRLDRRKAVLASALTQPLLPSDCLYALYLQTDSVGCRNSEYYKPVHTVRGSKMSSKNDYTVILHGKILILPLHNPWILPGLEAEQGGSPKQLPCKTCAVRPGGRTLGDRRERRSEATSIMLHQAGPLARGMDPLSAGGTTLRSTADLQL